MLINRNNYEEFFLLYVDGELNASDRIAVEKFAEANPDLREELYVLQSTVIAPDNNIVFKHKEKLYRKEDRKVISFIWWRVAASLIILFGAATWGWKALDRKENLRVPVAGVTSTIPAEQKHFEQPAVAEQKTIPTKAKNATIETATKTNQKQLVRILEKKAKDEAIAPRKGVDVSAEMKPAIINSQKEDIAMAIITDPTGGVIPIDPLVQEQKNPPVYEYVDATDDDVIYVANTSVSKRNKFRGVIRKATRILDRVTSTQ